MAKNQLFDDIIAKINKTIPSSVKEFGEDVEKNVRHLMQASFAKFDVVTRKEFDAQAKVLQRTRQKVEALTKKLTELEAKLKKPKA